MRHKSQESNGLGFGESGFSRSLLSASAALCRIVLSAIVVVSLGATDASAMAVHPPDGVYRYELRQGSTKIGESMLTLHSSNATVSVIEDAVIGPVHAKIAASYDANTLRENTYVIDASANGATRHGIVTPIANGVNLEAGAQSIDVEALPDAPLVIIADNFINSMFMTPSILNITKPAVITEAATAGGKALRTTVVTEGPGVIMLDVSGLQMRYTYDPTTFILEKVEVPAQHVLITRVVGAATS